jgi:hypothetical protein
MQRQNLEERAEKTLRDTDAYQVPVPIHLVAQRLNLTLEAATLGDKISGLLVVQGDRARIGYNAAHARVKVHHLARNRSLSATCKENREGAAVHR